MPIIQNFASESIPANWKPHLKWSWVVLLVLGGVLIWLSIKQRRAEKLEQEDDNAPVVTIPPAPFPVKPAVNQNFSYDVYISFAAEEKAWIEKELIPRLVKTKISFAMSAMAGIPGVPVIKNQEEGVKTSKRTLLVLSPAYLKNYGTDFENVLAQTLGIQEGSYRVLPIIVASLENTPIPTRLSMLTTLDFTTPALKDFEFNRLMTSLASPLPRINN
jgi:hypothetical protein